MKFWTGTAFMSTPEVPAITRMLDEAGYYGTMVVDHLIYPRELSSPYPSPDGRPFWAPETAWPHAWVLIGAIAGITTNLRISNSVYIAPARPILEVAKQVATASVLSRGRVALGVGAGWMREEFDLLGQDFSTRGRRLDEMIEALRALWQGGWVSWHGTYYEIPELMMEPHPQSPVPIYCGGWSEAGLRRAASHCDGWVGAGYNWEEAERYVGKLRSLLREYGRENDPFEIIVALTEEPSPDLYKRAEDELGLTSVMCSPWSRIERIHVSDHAHLKNPAERYREPIERFAEEIVAKCV